MRHNPRPASSRAASSLLLVVLRCVSPSDQAENYVEEFLARRGKSRHVLAIHTTRCARARGGAGTEPAVPWRVSAGSRGGAGAETTPALKEGAFVDSAGSLAWQKDSAQDHEEGEARPGGSSGPEVPSVSEIEVMLREAEVQLSDDARRAVLGEGSNHSRGDAESEGKPGAAASRSVWDGRSTHGAAAIAARLALRPVRSSGLGSRANQLALSSTDGLEGAESRLGASGVAPFSPSRVSNGAGPASMGADADSFLGPVDGGRAASAASSRAFRSGGAPGSLTPWMSPWASPASSRAVSRRGSLGADAELGAGARAGGVAVGSDEPGSASAGGDAMEDSGGVGGPGPMERVGGATGSLDAARLGRVLDSLGKSPAARARALVRGVGAVAVAAAGAGNGLGAGGRAYAYGG